MAWLDKRRSKDGTVRYRIRERINGKVITVVRNAGRWKDLAGKRLELYEKQAAVGDKITIPLSIEEMCDIQLENHGTTLKGGKSDHYKSSYNLYRLRMEQVKRFWSGRFAKDISELDVRKFIMQFNAIGTRMRWLGVLGNMFRNLKKWNDKGLLKHHYDLPFENPVTLCRGEMKPSEKREIPDGRVLTKEEWAHFAKHLSKRARAICEIALRRFLRMADIAAISALSISQNMIKGIQQKTGEPFTVPMIDDQPHHYDFTNFRREFKNAQIKAGLDFPPGHPLHFSPKDLRRTGATWYYNETKDLRGVQKMLGHKKLSTTERYLHVSEADLKKVAETMDSLVKLGGEPVESKRTNEDKWAY